MIRGRWRWAAALVALSCAAVALPPTTFVERATGDPLPFTVTVDPSRNLTDGQPVNITIRQTSDTVTVYDVVSRVCRAGVSYQPSAAGQPADDFFLGGVNCPSTPVSSSAMTTIADPFAQSFASRPEGSTSRFVVGVGTAQWVTSGGQDQTLTCDADNSCLMVTEVRFGPVGSTSIHWEPVTTALTFQPDDPVAGCGGPADGVLLSGGSDRMADAWVRWTIDECKREGRPAPGALSRAVFTGEGASVESFGQKGLDLVYTAAGFDPDVGLLRAGESEPRAVVAVPIAVNATVLGVSGGRRVSGGKVPYQDIRLSLDEVSALLSGGVTGVSDLYAQIFAANPELNETGFFDTTSGFPVGATAETDSGSWFITNYLTTVAADSWKVPDLPLFGADAGRARGADASLALADPTYALSLTLLSGRPPVRKAVAAQLLNIFATGGMWFFTDHETATALGMTSVTIANANGDFVPVDMASIYAGVASMRAGTDGMLLPDPEVTAPVDGVVPYPLAYVEYALVPAEPLVDGSCNLRSSSQANLDEWLTYVTGEGQGDLPPGLLPLPADLKAQAAERIAQVGQSPITGACAGAGSTTTTTTAPVDERGVTVTPNGLPARRVSNTNNGGNAGATTDGSGQSGPTTTTSPAVIVAVPAFAGRRTAGWTRMLLAFAGIIGVCGLAAVAGSSRELRPGRATRRR